MKKRLYFGGPWFTAEQEEEHNRLYALLKDKFDVFNPRLEGEVTSTSSADFMTQCLIGNVEGIKNADVVLAIYDGKDTGTIWEAGFAYACKKPVVFYAEKLNGKKFNLMLAKTGHYASNEKELLELLSKPLEFKDVYDDYKGEVE